MNSWKGAFQHEPKRKKAFLMDFSLSTEQVGLTDTLSRFVAEEYAPERRAAMLAQHDGYDPECWKRLTELGFVALAISAEEDGLDGSMVDLTLASKAIGKGLVLDPWLPTFIACRLLERLGSPAQKSDWLGKLAEGEAVLGFAHTEAAGWQSHSACSVTAVERDGGYDLNGSKLVGLCSAAQVAIVSARTSGANDAADGMCLFLVPMGAEGVSIRRYRLADGSAAMAIDLTGCHVDKAALLGPEGGAFAALEATLAEASLLIASEAVGIMEEAITRTVEHLKTRKQFGVAIGTFQAVQHRMADCVAQLELAKALVTKAAILGDDEAASPSAKQAACYGAKAFVAQTARMIAEETVQFHGAMGITEELWVGRAMKRLLVTASLFGDERTFTAMRNDALHAHIPEQEQA